MQSRILKSRNSERARESASRESKPPHSLEAEQARAGGLNAGTYRRF